VSSIAGGIAGGAAAATAAEAAPPREVPPPAEPVAERDEIRIPLMREEIGIEKVARESGHVRIRKTIHVEERHFSVPVTREDVEIEHIPIGRDAALAADGAFQEDTVDVPLYEEEVRVSKHSVVDEEVVVRTVAHSEERQASATLRHEEAEIEDTRTASGRSGEPGDDDDDYRR
jgi:uncharacterized protein (TIGR02271 family)